MAQDTKKRKRKNYKNHFSNHYKKTSVNLIIDQLTLYLSYTQRKNFLHQQSPSPRSFFLLFLQFYEITFQFFLIQHLDERESKKNKLENKISVFLIDIKLFCCSFRSSGTGGRRTLGRDEQRR